MKAISNWIDRFCYKHPRLGIPDLMKYVVLANAVVFALDLFTNNFVSNLLSFYWPAIAAGQVWRLVTFVLVPATGGGGMGGFGLFAGVFLFAMTSFFYYWIGSALERHLGTTRFTVFYALGILLNIIYGVATQGWVDMYYIHMSMFFSFATLYPDMRVLLYGIIPLKVKWLAWLDVCFFVYNIFFYLSAGLPVYAFMPVIAILNYFIFFWGELSGAARYKKESFAHRTSKQTVNFKKAQQEVKQRKGYLHKCSVCGVTDTDNPNMEFRYCSRCNGYYCYCMDHINNHQHVL